MMRRLHKRLGEALRQRSKAGILTRVTASSSVRSSQRQSVRQSLVAVAHVCLVLLIAACGLASPDDAEQGEVLYDKLCASCHPGSGPDLTGVVDRPIGDLQSYDYSDALRHSPGHWTAERLRLFLKGPQKMFPNGRMMIKPLSDEEARSVVSYLMTL